MRTSPPITLTCAGPTGAPRFASVQEALIAAAPLIVALIKANEVAATTTRQSAPGAGAAVREGAA